MKRAGPGRALAAGAASIAGLIGMVVLPSGGVAGADGQSQIKHVLLISVDGMHQSDLEWYVAGFRPDCGAGVRFMIKAGLVVMPPG